MLAGDVDAVVADAGTSDAVASHFSTTDPAAAKSTAARSALASELALASEIVLVDADVEPGEDLAALMRRGVDVVLIDGSTDPLTQVGEVLSGRHGVKAVHILSHGDAGQLRLGGEMIDANRLLADSSELESWRSSLAPGADILLYGCDVAAGEIGGRFVQTLSRLTGADVAASTDRTGSARAGGDWALESRTGRIDADLFASLADLRSVQVVLPITFDDQGSLPDYDDFGSVSGMTLNGDARQTGDYLELTTTEGFQAGSAFFDQAISLTGGASFQSSFSFQMADGGGTVGGDGLTFTIQNDPRGAEALGLFGSYLGYEGITDSVAVEFDTFKWKPSELNDNHVAVISGTFQDDLAVADSGFDLNDGGIHHAWVDYDGTTDTLSVFISQTANKPGVALLQTTIDLESVVGDQAYFGFTSGTGDNTNSHRILDWQLDGQTVPNPGVIALASGNLAVDEDAGQARIDVIRSGGSDGQVTVDYATQSDTATAGNDYSSRSGTLTFADGQTVKTIVVPILNDSNSESTERFNVTINNVGGGATLSSPQSTVVAILDDDGSTTLPSYGDFSSVSGMTLNGDARQTGDYLELTTTEIFQAGSAFFDQAISLTGGASFQSSFSFQMADGGGTVGGDGLTFTIQNDPRGAEALGLFGSYLGYEGITDSVAVEFDTFKWKPSELNDNHVAVISGTFQDDLAVADSGFDLNDGGIHHAWVDYDGTTDTLSVFISQTANKPGVALLQTTIDLESVVGDQAYFGFTSGTGDNTNSHRILDWQLDGQTVPNPGVIALASGNLAVDEDAGQARIDVIRSGGSDGQVTVDYATQSDTATAGNDYSSRSGTLTFADGQTVKTIVVPILNDSNSESTERFNVTINNVGGGATLSSPQSTVVTIFDDDGSTTLPSYGDFSSVSGLTLNGDAQQTGDALELTTNANSQAGSAFYDQTVSLAGDASFQSTFSFQILGGSGGADGMTFTIQNDPRGAEALGLLGSYLGYEGITNSVAVEFDTFKYLPSELNDNHVSVISGTYQDELAVADPGFDLNDGGVYHAWVDYDGASDTLSVYFSATDTKPGVALLETTVDLESVVGDQAYFGFTAGTGTITNSHRILSWELEDEAPTSSGPNAGVIGLATNNVSVNEDAGEARIDVLRTNGSEGEVTVDYATQAHTADAGSDFTPQSGTLTFADGETFKTIVVPIVDDSNSESTEEFKITIDNVNGGATLLVPRTATVTIYDDEAQLPNYADFGSVAGLDLNGDAQQAGAALELTDASNFQVGSAFYGQSLSMIGDASFRSAFSFQLLGGNGADGFTFTVQNDPAGAAALGAAGSSLGYEGITNSVAVEFDTFKNYADEINDNHVAIVSGSVANELRLRIPNFDLNSGDRYYAWVDYNGISDVLAVYLSQDDTKPTFALLKTTIDLESVVGDQAYFGFTAATGGLNNAHQILNWQLDRETPPLDPPISSGGIIVANNVVTGLNQPTAVDWLPDGTMLIAEKGGVVRVAAGGSLESTPFIDISDIVNGVRDRGLLDIAVHPEFESNPYVYLLFTYEGVEPEDNNAPAGTLAGPDGIGNRAGRLIRVTADAQNNYRTAVAGSDVILLGTNSTRAYFNASANSTVDFGEPPAGELPDGSYVQDFINSDSESHTVGGLAFGVDGALFVSTGDGASYNRVDVRADRVQDIDSLSGKILRIDPITGEGLSDNPFYDVTNDPDTNSSKVYQLGLRNPFRIAVDEATGQLYVGEVGWTSWEEINAAGPGANFGWPFYEGGSGQSFINSSYANTPEGQAFFANYVPVEPSIFAMSHQVDGAVAIVMGGVYHGSNYGSQYEGDIFFSDLGQGIVRHASLDASGNVTDVQVFATGASVVVAITEGPDETMYYVDLVDGTVGRWELV